MPASVSDRAPRPSSLAGIVGIEIPTVDARTGNDVPPGTDSQPSAQCPAHNRRRGQ
jgi:hypothetical protein